MQTQPGFGFHCFKKENIWPALFCVRVVIGKSGSRCFFLFELLFFGFFFLTISFLACSYFSNTHSLAGRGKQLSIFKDMIL